MAIIDDLVRMGSPDDIRRHVSKLEARAEKAERERDEADRLLDEAGHTIAQLQHAMRRAADKLDAKRHPAQGVDTIALVLRREAGGSILDESGGEEKDV